MLIHEALSTDRDREQTYRRGHATAAEAGQAAALAVERGHSRFHRVHRRHELGQVDAGLLGLLAQAQPVLQFRHGNGAVEQP